MVSNSVVGIHVSFPLVEDGEGDVVKVLAHSSSSGTAVLVYKAARESAYLAFLLAAAFSAVMRARMPSGATPVGVELCMGWSECWRC